MWSPSKLLLFQSGWEYPHTVLDKWQLKIGFLLISNLGGTGRSQCMCGGTTPFLETLRFNRSSTNLCLILTAKNPLVQSFRLPKACPSYDGAVGLGGDLDLPEPWSALFARDNPVLFLVPAEVLVT